VEGKVDGSVVNVAIRGYFRNFRIVLYGVCTSSVCVGFRVFFPIYIYIIDVNLDYLENNSRLSMDIGKLSNHVKYVPLSFLISLFRFYIVYHYCARLQHVGSICSNIIQVLHNEGYVM
jgi:hypothetical protein